MAVIAVDVMSGDRDPRERLRGALHVLRSQPRLTLLLVGVPAVIEPPLTQLPATLRSRAELVPAAGVIAMDQAPRAAVRRGRDSSMRIALELVKARRASACVSAGNTGALAAIAHFVLKNVADVERAAILSAIPSALGHTYMLDLGANTRATPRQLTQFARMGAVAARELYGLSAPRIGLLNVGEEDEKGNAVAKEAHQMLRAVHGLNFLGNVEGRDILAGQARGNRIDVVVCDGFVGNAILKFYESAGRMFAGMLQTSFPDVLGRPEARELLRFLDSSSYGGAPLLGVKGVAIICHGASPAPAIMNAVRVAGQMVRSNLSQDIGAELARGGAVA